ncbi:hypothetical protein QR98_0061560 [Sarcoptes scabiei]|uniref:Glycerol-3-phosphate acyltransferase 4 n=1 Tax=Sarcoptes scabiei TaxID=52283 RepID=A0A132A9T9_SARSC|nr:hypothetical protein QR98_0061560 [Sarcoptes scabiei]
MGIEAIVDDQVTKRFAAEELPTWNLLTRTNKFHHTRSFRLAIVWVIGFVFRYTLLPIRCLLTMIGVFCLFIIMASIGPISECRLKRKIYHFSSIMCFRILSRCVSAVITYHDEENRAKPGGISVLKRTCINNSAVMMFKKGSFEIDTKFYPVAIKYDVRFGDPFWNSSKYGYIRYLLMMMTSWAIVCDVWYLPPMTRDPKETAIEFANRVKRNIACKGNLVDLEWDGQLKRKSVNPELVKEQQYKFSQTLRKFP